MELFLLISVGDPLGKPLKSMTNFTGRGDVELRVISVPIESVAVQW